MVEHDLTPEQLAELCRMLKKGKARWTWLKHPSGLIHRPAIRVQSGNIIEASSADGTSPALVVEAAYRALAAKHKRKSDAAKQGARTRARRQDSELYRIAKQTLIGGETGPNEKCLLCGRHLGDAASIERGIGSECWGKVLAQVEVISKQVGTDKLMGRAIDIQPDKIVLGTKQEHGHAN